MDKEMGIVFFFAGMVSIFASTWRMHKIENNASEKKKEDRYLEAVLFSFVGIIIVSVGIALITAGSPADEIPANQNMVMHSYMVNRGDVSLFMANLQGDNVSSPILYVKRTAYIHDPGEIMPGDTVIVKSGILYKV